MKQALLILLILIVIFSTAISISPSPSPDTLYSRCTGILKDSAECLKYRAEGVRNKIGRVVTNTKEKVASVSEKIIDTKDEIEDYVKNKAIEAKDSTEDFFKKKGEEVKDEASHIKEKVEDIKDDVKDFVKDKAEKVKDRAANFKEKITDIKDEIVHGIYYGKTRGFKYDNKYETERDDQNEIVLEEYLEENGSKRDTRPKRRISLLQGLKEIFHLTKDFLKEEASNIFETTISSSDVQSSFKEKFPGACDICYETISKIKKFAKDQSPKSYIDSLIDLVCKTSVDQQMCSKLSQKVDEFVSRIMTDSPKDICTDLYAC